MKRIIFWMILGKIFCSCSNIPFLFGDKDLGNGYYYSEDGKFSSIIYSTKKPYKSSGLEVIPAMVISYNFNDLYIIVKSIESKSQIEYYWIIDKNISIDLNNCYDQNSCDSILKSNVKGPIDSIDFEIELKRNNIKLSFKSTY